MQDAVTSEGVPNVVEGKGKRTGGSLLRLEALEDCHDVVKRVNRDIVDAEEVGKT